MSSGAGDGSTTIYFSPTQPAGIERGNWIQTDPKKGWFTILRLYSPLEPFFAKTWRPSEVERVQWGHRSWWPEAGNIGVKAVVPLLA